MLDESIPFEIHLTTVSLPLSRQTDFVSFCSENNAKALTIELARGEFIKQPMLTRVILANDLDRVLTAATELSNLLAAQQFPAIRLKIEVPSYCWEKFRIQDCTVKQYFEWHGKIDYNQIEKLQFLCQRHQVHLSRNALSSENETRFITLREFGDKSQFEKRIEALLTDLKRGKWSLLKQRSEYCIYDSNQLIDTCWLSQE